ncbi:dormancy-associated protein homolog 3 [Morus notabilis]|uniref:dormancy-associated protein homolog 3 n=1 Tax=Morus notabilis TaxID=981085 RepID=UPI000CED4AA1|nr:dormancy-associated protein homolog 3 [Morus notabilis]
MGLLDQLWDDTVAGPRPENERGKLRKYSSFSFRPNSGKDLALTLFIIHDFTTDQLESFCDPIDVIGRRPPVSPAGSTPPVSPFSGGRESFRFRRRSTSDAYEKATETGPRSSPPSPYDV